MAGRVSIQCPGCLAKLNLADDSKLGKKIKCPKCSDIFVAALAEDDDMEDLQDDDAPAKLGGGRKRSAAAGKKSGKKGKSSGGGGSNTPLIAGGAVAVVVLIGAGLFFSGVFGGGNKPLPAPPVAEVPAAAPAVVAPAPVAPAAPAITATERTLGLRWMPAETELVVHVKIAELWKAPLLKKLVDMPEAAAGVQQMQQATGLAPTDIESVSLGFADMQGLRTMAMSQMMGLPASIAPKVLAVVRTKKPLSLDEILKTEQTIQAAEHGSKKFFQYAAGTPDEGGGWLADSTTLILAPLALLKATMDRGESTTPARKELLFADASPHVVLLFAPKDLKSLTAGAPIPPMSPSQSPNAEAMGKAMTESLTAFSLGITLRGGFDLQTSLLLKDADSAGKVKAGFDEGLVEGRKQFEAIKMTAPPLLAELGELLLANLKSDVQGQTVKISTGLPDSAQQKLVEDLPPVMMMMMALAGGMNFGGGNPFAEPGAKFPGIPSGPPGFGPGEMPPGFGPKNPGETEPVSAELATGIPDGTTLTASTSWGRFPTFTADGKSVYPMQLILDLKGDALGSICAFGQVGIKTGSLAGGGTLKVSKAEILGQPNPVKSLVPFDAAEPSPFEHPEETLRITFTVDGASDKETTIAALEGTFKIVTSDEAGEFTIDEAPKAAKRPLTDPGLKAAGVKLVKSAGPIGEVLTLSCAKGFFLGKAKASNPNDANAAGVVMFFTPEIEKTQLVQKLNAFTQDQKFPEKLQVQVKVHKGAKEQTVTFKFADVPLPSPETKPKVQEGGQQPPFGQPAPNAGPETPNGPRVPNGLQAPN